MNGGTGFGIDFADLEVVAGNFEADSFGMAGEGDLDYPAFGGVSRGLIGRIEPKEFGRRYFWREDGAFERVGDGNFRRLVERRGKGSAGWRMKGCAADEKYGDCAGSSRDDNLYR